MSHKIISGNFRGRQGLCPDIFRNKATNIEINHSFVEVNEPQNSSLGTLEAGKDYAQIFSETRPVIKKKVKFRKRTEQLDSLDCSDQSQIDKHPEEVGLTNTDQTDTVSGPTQSDEGNSEEKINSFDANETNDVSLDIGIPPVCHSRKKLIVLDLNGILADIVYAPPNDYTPDAYIAGRAIFKRPYCDDLLKLCCERFEVGIWSSRHRKNVEKFIDYLMGDIKPTYCNISTFIQFNMNDNILGEEGDLKVYLERLALADNVRNFVEQNPFGQIAITERSQDWGFYSQVIDSCLWSELQNDVGLPICGSKSVT
ncbi:Haloacid dehalogenase-like hydrolase superfamily protein, putative isoform 4 [Hibiscus syriacus]|uniref:Mitochondrial import inner membrane translocase subunit TIM50 n=1 Tax=Hibiscus syriacus TaxID=106335 RepID=A0A6A2XM57_HIBSY|nr:Haloacid dehalogenase-like hydrolase superfamily protein, putative isoform 4 [Hibiscus syriacus]